MATDEDQTFTSAEVSLAAGLLRSTFDTWLLRRYLPLPMGPGTGRARTFSFRDAVRVAVAAELTRLGIPAGVAGRVVSAVEPDDGKGGGYLALLLAASAVEPRSDILRGPATQTARIASPESLESLLKAMVIGGPPAGHVVINITAITERTRAILRDPARADDLFPKVRDPLADMMKPDEDG